MYDFDQCYLEVPGTSEPQELVDQCSASCEEVSKSTGEVGDYDPNQLEESYPANKAQVKRWAECIDETSCDNIVVGYCPSEF